MKPNQIDIQVTNKGDFDFFEKDNIISYVRRFAEKNTKLVNSGKLSLYIKQQKEKYRGVSYYYCKIKFWTDRGVFFSQSQDFGYIPTVHRALARIIREFSKKRERTIPKIMARHLKYIRRFPAMV